MKRILAIDPGLSGAIAERDEYGNVQTWNMPKTFPEIADLIRELTGFPGIPEAYLEKVGFHMKGNAASSSAKFARHVGHLEMCLYMCGIPTTEVSPGVWMKKLGALPKEKKDRKNKIKEIMAQRYPYLKVTLANADALGILTVMGA